MADTPKNAPPPWAAGVEARWDEVFPVLDQEEIARFCRYGEPVSLKAGQMLWRTGDRQGGAYLVLSGAVEIVGHDLKGETLLVTLGPGQFSGEIASMVGDAALVGARAAEDSEAIHVTRDQVRRLLVTEPELGERVLLAFTLRRMRMVAEHLGEVALVGEQDDRMLAELRTFLSRNGVPYEIYDEAEARPAMAERGAADAALPAVICGDRVLSRPTLRSVAECLGLAVELAPGARYDLAVIGAGPAGLAAAIYGASEGLSVIVLEACAPGGQAATSSRIENYLGFPTGISGQALLGRAYLQANKFGARVTVARSVRRLSANGAGYELVLEGDDALKAGSVVIASGAVYRNPGIAGMEAFEGAGVHYAATHIESQLCRGSNVIVVGGGNSAGQAAVFLSRYAHKVTILVRGEGLAASMSHYLIDRIESLPNVELVTHSEIVELRGEGRLSGARVKDSRTSEARDMAVDHVFIFIGARPATDFAADLLALDDKGFILTGDALTADALAETCWPAGRRPFLLETSRPGVFAAGDVRSGSTKRVAAAVGEGAACVQFVHQRLAEAERQESARAAS